MPVLGLTGGVATGKSTVGHLLAGKLEAVHFDADLEVGRLLREDSGVIGEVKALLGPGVFGADGLPDRRVLRDLVFRETKSRRCLEGILHPRVRAGWNQIGGNFKVAGQWLVVEVPLLYEVGAEVDFSTVVVVACSRERQMARLTEERGLDLRTARGIIQAQMDASEKVRRSVHTVWNDGTREALVRQVDMLAALLRRSEVPA